ncbi:flavodoxin family protein [Caldisalinibacter kiritimatiensis]|uniref:Flavodoxin n=1 Tax=Caldisalinibacter kiritimatiensis TaxID=1304284 RepID=R1CCW5_9FIRM|nr:flavodoxin family protein [Caldisalinibacter kiritimatiensis]EOD00135.1 Flavodoxin [Caldisalinibacter kiritimatiensis]
MKILLIYSSKTGNTKKVAEGIYKILPEGSVLAPVEDNVNPEEFDLIIIGFWVDKGIADEKARKYMKNIKGKKIGLFGTLGAYPDSEHAKKSMRRTKEIVEYENEIVGEFLCQGKIDSKLTKNFEKLPPNHPHAMTEETRKRHEEASKHPNEDDIEKAQSVFKDLIYSL